YRTTGGGGFNQPATATVGKNPPNGVVVNYWLKNKVAKEVTLEFVDNMGGLIRKFTKRPEGPDGQTPPAAPGETPVPADAGLNTFVWNFRRSNATNVTPPAILWAGSLNGPRIPPGDYEVILTVDGKQVGRQKFVVKEDPRVPVTQEDLQAQYELMTKIGSKINDTHAAITEIRDLKSQLEGVQKRIKGDKALSDMASDISKKLAAVEEALIQTKIRSGQDALNFPIRLNNKLAALSSSIDSADAPPTAQQMAVWNELSAQVDAHLAELARIKSTQLAEFNKQYAAKGLPVVSGK
ncbi:MAG TPA: hypothetical protein VL501_00475, partial [Pyrinomonadaceae bacterium]|nr:hypothetical protein [Pyrinomonadaceae bacterium]